MTNEQYNKACEIKNKIIVIQEMINDTKCFRLFPIINQDYKQKLVSECKILEIRFKEDIEAVLKSEIKILENELEKL